MTPSSSHQSPRLWIQERQVHTVLRLRKHAVVPSETHREPARKLPGITNTAAPSSADPTTRIRPTIRQNFRQPRTRVGDAA